MKVLHLIRHAKSDRSSPSMPDISRSINAKGLQNCELMAQQMVKAGCQFKHVYSSPAVRAKMTIEAIAKTLSEQQLDWMLGDDLYTFSSNDILKWCRKLADDQSDVVLIGHNPALTEFCNQMVGEQAIANMPTSSYAQLSFEVNSWKELAPAMATLEVFLKPNMFKN